MAVVEQTVLEALKGVIDPNTGRDFVSSKAVKNLTVTDGDVAFDVTLGYPAKSQIPGFRKELIAAAKSVAGVANVSVNIVTNITAHAVQRGVALLPKVKNIVAVASGKGGVGKSTVASNLAVALSQSGLRVGLCDCDLYGPSIAHMFGTDERPYQNDEQQIVPIEKHGLQLMSMGFLLEDASPVIVRGPIATRYTQQFLRQCAWNDLDVLVLDLPPGTGDIQLTIVQTVSLDGAVIVTTPQEVALIDARKAVGMFQKVNVPILGIIENMSYFLCPSDGKVYHIFGKGGGEHEAKRLGVPLLGQIPIEMDVRESGDEGHPIALEDPAKSASSKVFREIAAQLR
ncbi:MAG: Mrp/NBP35 family ATP-binding protein [Rhodoferax sp.]|uniref:Mrp/NBP35 family ATP-binding protein n=1 Tax=Rhodoferax sp. TaxID=50421 RepID=UPI002730377B|nr:Mrp/NBP35 family ATP-binding protein [Rhodoferax sp.]MDP1528836.1 Mrp/NBP35 family ATP-binding protein [Rhodoferax sp.]